LTVLAAPLWFFARSSCGLIRHDVLAVLMTDDSTNAVSNIAMMNSLFKAA
jgi:hypothetical protein